MKYLAIVTLVFGLSGCLSGSLNFTKTMKQGAETCRISKAQLESLNAGLKESVKAGEAVVLETDEGLRREGIDAQVNALHAAGASLEDLMLDCNNG